MIRKFRLFYVNRYVGGFSLKTGKVWYTKDVSKARVFTSEKMNRFIADHANCGKFFDTALITIEEVVRVINR